MTWVNQALSRTVVLKTNFGVISAPNNAERDSMTPKRGVIGHRRTQTDSLLTLGSERVCTAPTWGIKILLVCTATLVVGI